METIVWSMNDIDTAKIIAARIMFRFCPPPRAIVPLPVVTHSTGWSPSFPEEILPWTRDEARERVPTLRADSEQTRRPRQDPSGLRSCSTPVSQTAAPGPAPGGRCRRLSCVPIQISELRGDCHENCCGGGNGHGREVRR